MKEIKGAREELDKKGAEIIRDSISNALEDKKEIVLAVAGGRSVSGIFRELLELEIPWTKVHIFLVDERLVPLDAEESNYRLAMDSFIGELLALGKITEENVHPFVLNEAEEGFGIKSYEEELKRFGGEYDVVLLSAGEDGHIGGLYPDHHSVKSDAEFFLVMDDSPKDPPERMTMSRKLLLKARSAVLVFFGEGKRQAYEMFNDEKVELFSLPAKIVKSIEDSYVLTDLK